VVRSLVLLSPLLSACELATAPLPDGAVRFDAPAVYAQWWSLTEQCSGLAGDFSKVKWYVVPGVTDLPLNGEGSIGGIWYAQGDRIVLADGQQLAGDLVRHEMLHALLQSGDHPRSAFVDHCEGTVVCFEECRDGAPPPDPSADTVAPSALQIALAVTPTAPSPSMNGGNFMMVITVTNTASTPVIAALPPSGDASPPIAYSYDIRSASRQSFYTLSADYPEVARFSAHQTKHFIFDFHVVPVETDNRYEIAPGNYTFSGAFGLVAASNPQAVTVSP
jgi:hypothetical protein